MSHLNEQRLEKPFGNPSKHLPQRISLFGNTRLEKKNSPHEAFRPRTMVTLPFTGEFRGEIRLWVDIQFEKLRPSDRARAKGIISEMANILAGMSVSKWADVLNSSIMLSPPMIDFSPAGAPRDGHDYFLYLLDGHCSCRVEVVEREAA